jgi:hypothetical protein
MRVGGGIRDKPSSDRIQMDVSYEFKEIAVRVDQDRLVAPLKQVSAAMLAAVNPPCIAKREVLDDDGKLNPTDLDKEVHMVRHPAVAVNAIPKSPDSLGDESFQLGMISFAKENPLAAIAAQDDVVYPAGDMNSRFPCHGRKPSILAL